MRDRLRVILVILEAALDADRRTTFVAAGLAVLGWIVIPLQALAIKFFVDTVTEGDVEAAAFATIAAGVTVGGLWYFNNVRQLVRMTVQERTVHELERRLQRLAGDIDGIEHLERTDYLDRLSTLRSQGYHFGNIGALLDVPALLLNVAITAALLAALDPVLLLVPLAFLPSLVLTGRADLRLRQAEAEEAQDRRLAHRLLELGTDPAAAGEARLFNARAELLARRSVAARRVRAAHNRAGVVASLLSMLGWAIYAAAFGLAMLVVLSGMREGRLAIGDFFLAFFLIRGLSWQAEWAQMSILNVARTIAATRNYLWISDYAAAAGARRPAAPAPLPAPGPLRFEGVSFRYPGAERAALEDVTLDVPAGAVLALVGDNGAGKTTMVKLLARFYEPTAGRITLNGVDIAGIDVGAWRESLTACFQDFSRFELLTRETVGVGDVAAVDDVARVTGAVEAAGATEVVHDLRDGLETTLGPSWGDGADLSTGQWQKLALGRAMMRPGPRLLLLDEPTAALDATSEARLFERYAAASEFARATGSISVIVSHRMSTVRMADLIAVVEDGRVRESGTHAQLLALGGAYRELYATQAAAYR